MDNRKITTGMVVIFFILYLLIFIVPQCFGETVTITYDSTYAGFYSRYNYGWNTLEECLDEVSGLAQRQYNYYDDENKTLYAPPVYTSFFGTTCSGYALLFMQAVEQQWGTTSMYLITVTNRAGKAHSLVEYRGVWYDPTGGEYESPQVMYYRYGWLEAVRYNYDQAARLSARHMIGVTFIVPDDDE